MPIPCGLPGYRPICCSAGICLPESLNTRRRHIQTLYTMTVTFVYRCVEIPVMNMPAIARRYGWTRSGLIIMSMPVFIHDPVFRVMDMAFSGRNGRTGDIQALVRMLLVARSMGNASMIMIQRASASIVHKNNPLWS